MILERLLLAHAHLRPVPDSGGPAQVLAREVAAKRTARPAHAARVAPRRLGRAGGVGMPDFGREARVAGPSNREVLGPDRFDLRRNPEDHSAGVAHFAGPAQGSGGLALVRIKKRIARAYSEAR